MFNPDMLTFDEPTHVYRYAGALIPSVTTVIKGGGSGVDYSSIPRHILERAAEIGTEVHKVAEDHVRLGSPLKSEDTSAEEYVVGLRQFFDSGVVDVIEAEQKLACPKYWFAGTVDIVGMVNGKLSVLDYKTTSKLHTDTVELQVRGGYAHMVEQYYGEDVEGYYAVWLKKKGKTRFELVPLNDNDNARYEFLQMVMDYNGS